MIQFSGMGSNAGIGQNTNPNNRWPLVRVKAYTHDIDLTADTSHVRITRVQNGTDQTQDRYVVRTSAWDSQYGFWLTPFGFLKGAAANNTAMKSETIAGTKYTVLSFRVDNKYNVTGYINDKNLIERIQTWVDNEVLGDMIAEVSYDVYKDFGGVKFPTSIIEKQGGFPVLILSVTDVKPNANVIIQPPQLPATSGSAAPSVQTEKVAEGVFYLKGGTHHSVAVEFADHVAVIEAPLSQERSVAVISEVKRIIPNKAIRYVVNTHHHFDHSGGLRTYVEEGATIVTHEINEGFYQRALVTPRTLNPARLAPAPNKPKIETVGERKILGDGTRTLELHLIKGNPHNDGILMAFLPKERLLIEVDVFTPQNAGAVQTVNPNTVNLAENAERLKLDFETVLPLHGSGAATRADLYKAINKPMPDMAVVLAAKPAAAPVDPGRRMLDMACTSCHSLTRVQNKNLPQEEWIMIVERMKDKGVELSDADTATVVDYLVKTYGPK
jgi:glyoxylase-like metal-dependent hydrolase (beta-lactamase superfamily II)